MSCFKKRHQGKAAAIITDAMLLDTVELKDGKPSPRHFFTHNAVWDTGSEVTVVTQKVIDRLAIKPTSLGGMSGIGGNQTGGIYTVQLVLPSGDLIDDLEVYCGDLPDYDVLIGMDVISQTDFLITNKDNTVFSFRHPSQGSAELE